MIKDTEIWYTMIHHSHNVDGSLRIDHCCGCFNVRPEELIAYCNECGEERNIASWLAGEDVNLFPTIHVPLTSKR